MDRTTLTDFFEEVETTEEYNGYFCSIAEAISIVVLGSLCGFKNVSQIHQWAESAHAREFLKEKFGIKHVPCYYWLLVLLKMVKPDTLNTCLMKWAAQYLPADRSQTTISLDGKTIRSTTGMKNIESPMHIISAQICEFGVTLASETVDEKSNEIPAVQELLKKLDIEGCLVVADALNLPFVYVRSTPKDHGLENLIEGELRPGMKVVVVEDLISTGGSSLKAVEAIRRDGCEVIGMVAAYTYGFPVAEKAFKDA